MRRTLLRTPAFARDLRNWLKSHPQSASSIEATRRLKGTQLVVWNRVVPLFFTQLKRMEKMMASTKRRYTKDDFAQRGDATYENDIRPNLKPEDEAKFVAIDIETGGYEVDAHELAACDRLRARLPEAQIWLVRVGSRYVHRFGGRERRGTS